MHRLIKATCAVAAEEAGKARAGRIAALAQKRFKEVCGYGKPVTAHTSHRFYLRDYHAKSRR